MTYTDFVTAGSMLGKELREKGCDYIIALTHMRTPNDIRWGAKTLLSIAPKIDDPLGFALDARVSLRVAISLYQKPSSSFRNAGVTLLRIPSGSAPDPPGVRAETRGILRGS